MTGGKKPLSRQKLLSEVWALVSYRMAGQSPLPASPSQCCMMMTKGMVFRYMWVYSKEDTMAHKRRPMVTS